MKPIKPFLLLILDGFGDRSDGDDNAILHAQKPILNNLAKNFPRGIIQASEHFVGLPDRQFGNSEVGHLNIGAGRIVQQDINRIDYDIRDNLFEHNLIIKSAMLQQGALHILGLLSDGGVHSHETHIHALIRIAQAAGVPKIYVHAFLDGRDTPPRSAQTYLARLEAVLAECPAAHLASITGRYWAMDRDKRWERIEPAYQLLVEGKGLFEADNGLAGLAAAYQRDENDEFVKATRIGPPAPMQDGDAVIFMNFRADRARQMVSALTAPNFDAFNARRPKFSQFITLTSYGAEYPHPVAYPPQTLHNVLGEYLSNQGLTQLRIAETEKYPHVTYFFNGGREAPFPGEDRILVPSPKVATYDLKPEMSAHEVTDHIIKAIESQKYDVIVCNYANGDMVGHSGIFEATVKAVETLDQCIGRCFEAIQKAGGEMLITADHGNCERMYDSIHHQPHTQHTLDPVPLLYIGRPATIRSGGSLRDIAPTLLTMMGLEIPEEMTGQSLINFKE